MNNATRAAQLYEEAISLDFLSKFQPSIYAFEVGLAPLVRPAGIKGYELVAEAAELGFAEAQYQLGVYHWFERHHREAACAHIENPYEQAKAMTELEKQDYQTAILMLNRAAEQNHGPACLLLGDIYSEHFFCGGLSEIPDDIFAFNYYKKGAEAKCADAMYRLGRCYYHGYGTSENDNAAFTWFSNAYAAGCKRAASPLGECYMKGFGTAQDIPRAIRLLEQDLKNNDTKVNLALIYQGVVGFRYADLAKAREYAASVPSDSDAYSAAQQILADMPAAEAEYQQWVYANSSSDSSNDSSGSGTGCYVATAVYGSYDCPQVWTLRRFRDFTLAETWYGRTFIRTYYAISPTLVKWFGHTAWFKSLWKGPLDRMVQQLQKDGVESTPYQDQIW